MGMMFSSLWKRLTATKRERKIVMIGNANAGKTTTLYKLLLDEVVVTAPTIGSNVEEVQYKNIKFVIWDLGWRRAAHPPPLPLSHSLGECLCVCVCVCVCV